MILDEAIKHYEEVVEELEEEAVKGCCDDTEIMNKCIESANEYRQLAEWLKELKQLREQTRWIPVNERLPEIHQDVLLSLRSLDVEVGFRATTEPYFYCHGTDGGYIEPLNVLGWRSKPEPYKESENNDR